MLVVEIERDHLIVKEINKFYNCCISFCRLAYMTLNFIFNIFLNIQFAFQIFSTVYQFTTQIVFHEYIYLHGVRGPLIISKIY